MKKKLPAIGFVPRPDWQKKCLAAWLDEWSLDQRLRENDHNEPFSGDGRPSASEAISISGLVPVIGFFPPSHFGPDIASYLKRNLNPNTRADGRDEESKRKLVRAFDRPIAVGQIRLLSPELTPRADRPLFVAVFGDWDEGEILIAPFSPFSVPATTGEWLTGRDTPVLRVLELWNARTVPMEALEDSWLVDDFKYTECKGAWHVFEHEVLGKPLESEFEQQVGPPLIHPDDPRRLYQREEVTFLEKLQTLAQGLQGKPVAESDAPALDDQYGNSSKIIVLEKFNETEQAYAASTEEPPPLDNLSADDLLPGFQGEAERDSDTPSEASVLRLAFYGPESPRPAEVPTGGVSAEWPGGQNGPHDFEYRAGAWWAQIRLNLPWPRTVVLLQEKKIRIKPVP